MRPILKLAAVAAVLLAVVGVTQAASLAKGTDAETLIL